MVPIHFDTFIDSGDAPGEAPRELRRVMAERGLGPEVVRALAIGEQPIFIRRAAPAATGRRCPDGARDLGQQAVVDAGKACDEGRGGAREVAPAGGVAVFLWIRGDLPR